MNDTIIVDQKSSAIKALARQTLKGRWVEAFTVSLIPFFIVNIPEILLVSLSKSEFLSWVATIYDVVITAPLSLGITCYFLKIFRMKPAGPEDIKSGFKYFGNALLLYFMMYVKILIRSFLFIIPGVIASLQYSQAWFLMADSPEKPAALCIEESKKLMNGNKTTYLLFMLSFMGWFILAESPVIFTEIMLNPALLSGEMTLSEFIAAGSSLTGGETLIVLASIGSLLVNIYVNTAQACFYDILTGNLVIRKKVISRAASSNGEEG